MLSIIIPDLHGDFEEFCNILYVYRILNENNKKYISEIMLSNLYKSRLNMQNKRIIQLGDILDSKNRNPNSKYSINYSDMLLFSFICGFKQAFPDQVILIMGNHELLNCRKVFEYVSPYSSRNSSDYSNIVNSVLSLFQYSFIDDFNNLFIHACIPRIAKSKHDLVSIDEFIKLHLLDLTNIQFSNLYNCIFKREYTSQDQLDVLGINRVFFGHMPHENVLVMNNNSTFYVDTMISRSFSSMLNAYECISINDDNSISIDTFKRFVRYNTF